MRLSPPATRLTSAKTASTGRSPSICVQHALAAVVVDERCGRALVDLETVAHRALVVVVALVELAAAHRARCRPRVDTLVILPHAAAGAPRGETTDDDLGVDVDGDDRVDPLAQRLELRVEASACATVRGKPSRMKPFSVSGCESRSLTSPITTSSGTSSPASM